MFWVFILICLMLLWGVVTRGANLGGKPADIGYSDLLDKIDTGQVQDAALQGTELRGHLKGQKDEFHTTIPASTDTLITKLHAANVRFAIKEPNSNLPLQLLFNIGPFVVLIAIWFFMLRQMQSRPCRSARAVRACSPCSRKRSHSRMWPASTRPRKS
jgi:cell division protease FtsH